MKYPNPTDPHKIPRFTLFRSFAGVTEDAQVKLQSFAYRPEDQMTPPLLLVTEQALALVMACSCNHGP